MRIGLVSEVSRLTRWNEEVHRSFQDHKAFLLKEDVLSFISDETVPWMTCDDMGLDVSKLLTIDSLCRLLELLFDIILMTRLVYERYNSGTQIKDSKT